MVKSKSDIIWAKTDLTKVIYDPPRIINTIGRNAPSLNDYYYDIISPDRGANIQKALGQVTLVCIILSVFVTCIAFC